MRHYRRPRIEPSASRDEEGLRVGQRPADLGMTRLWRIEPVGRPIGNTMQITAMSALDFYVEEQVLGPFAAHA